MRHLFMTAAACSVVLSGTAHADDHRDLGPHQHGRGWLKIAFEGGRVEIELEAPGADIVGFENLPSSAAETEQLASARATLGRPLELLGVPAAAKCTVASVKIEVEDEDHDRRARGQATDPGARHSEIEAEYRLACASAADFKGLSLGYFETFKRAQSLSVTVIGPKGQSQYEATRDKSVLSFGDVM